MLSFPYNSDYVEKMKSIKGYRWHPEGKYWSFPNSDGILRKILEVFEGEEVQLSQNLNPELYPSVITRTKSQQQFQHNFEDLKRELLSRKYSHKTIRGYLCFNRDFLNFTGKELQDITEADTKNYLVYLSEEKQSATSTLNQAINFLKFYYGTMLKKNFIYEVRGPRKDKKLPVVLSKEEVA
ncbi:MAG: phage integrase N-terminal SAM-like domain-containing protein, partial [Myxococcota bacterium]